MWREPAGYSEDQPVEPGHQLAILASQLWRRNRAAEESRPAKELGWRRKWGPEGGRGWNARGRRARKAREQSTRADLDQSMRTSGVTVSSEYHFSPPALTNLRRPCDEDWCVLGWGVEMGQAWAWAWVWVWLWLWAWCGVAVEGA